ncbi:MAG TPA: N-acetylmuramoyl-L-alanine amidase [Hellea balneolensis]|uniref:N-acetylmuramoyl-L-alanine amidase n=1 Tax=Hellea balneolensis TaxID=287478 RepID=A0A7V5NWQ4_9PROT|nr:N-acetylmuramoyl-L-alanine amidase [Hellea balneolensis]
MEIIEAPSPNFDERALAISMLVLHYTGMKDGPAALSHMQSKAAKVAAHYMVEEDGRIFRLVGEDKRAWHAGVSHWRGVTDVNSASIGIEIVNGGHDFGLPEYPERQIEAVIALSRDIKKRHNISDFNIVAHSDIAPERKQDPGEKFPWAQLADADIGIWPQLKRADRRPLVDAQSSPEQIRTLQKALAWYGYGIKPTGQLDEQTRTVITAFQRRYRPEKIDGYFDVETVEKIDLLVRYRKKVEGAAFVG